MIHVSTYSRSCRTYSLSLCFGRGVKGPERATSRHHSDQPWEPTVMIALYHNPRLSCFNRVHGSQACQMHASQLWIRGSSSHMSSSFDEVFHLPLRCNVRNLTGFLNFRHGLRHRDIDKICQRTHIAPSCVLRDRMLKETRERTISIFL